jgi:hypothetical protein
LELDDVFEFELNKDKKSWSVTGYKGESEEVVLPASYKGMPVKAIGDGFAQNNKRIKKIVVPEGFISIGESAFEGCIWLKNIKFPAGKRGRYSFPDGIIDIKSMVFYGCKRLINIALPESLKFIGDGVFEGCEGLKAITLPENLLYVGESAFENCPNLETVTLSRKTRIGYMAFEGFTGKLVYRD